MTSPVLSCQVCDAELHDGNAHFPHDRDCCDPFGCDCNNVTCPDDCTEPGCVGLFTVDGVTTNEAGQVVVGGCKAVAS